HILASARTANGLCRTFAQRYLLQLVVINVFGVAGDAVRNDFVSLARKIQMMAVGQMSAMRQIQPENRVARLQNGEIGAHVGLAASMRLHVGVLGAERSFGAFAGQVFDDIGMLAAAVMTPAGL